MVERVVAGNEVASVGVPCIRMLHKYYYGEKTEYSGSLSCPEDCLR